MIRSMILALIALSVGAYDSQTCLPHTSFFGLRILNGTQDANKIYSVVSNAIISGATSGESLSSPKFIWEASPSGIVSVWSS